MNGGYPGKVYPIHSCHKKKWNQPARPSLLALDSKVDLVVLAEPVTSASQIVKECIEADVGGLVMISGGGKETGIEDRASVTATNCRRLKSLISVSAAASSAPAPNSISVFQDILRPVEKWRLSPKAVLFVLPCLIFV